MSINSFLITLFIALFCFAGVTRWQELDKEPLIMSDGQGYYAYLPAIVLHQDLQFGFLEGINQRYYAEDKRAEFVHTTPEGNVNKYFAGTAFLQAPFFVGGCVLSLVLRQPVDGYSWPFQLMVGLAALVYLVLGLYLLGRLLLELGFSERHSLFALALLALGTNLFYYTLYEPSMSHVYSFFSISAFLYATFRAGKDGKTIHFLMAAATLGATVLIRPTNGIILLAVPALMGGWTETKTLFLQLFKNRLALVASLVLTLLIVGIQPAIYWLQTGKALVYSYGGEGFDFLAPEISNVLFSYRKGLFIYCPVLMFGLLGLLLGLRNKRWQYAWLLLSLGAITWLISSWWMWYYGGSYGHRAFIEFYPLFGIGLASVLSIGSGFMVRWSAPVLAVVFIPLSLIQTYQYNKHIITFDNMNKHKFWSVFGLTGSDLAWYYSGYEGQDSYSGIDSVARKHDMEQELGWGNEQQRTEQKALEGTWSAVMLPDDQYGPTARIAISDLGPDKELVRISAYVSSNSRITDVAFVCSLEDSTGASYYWKKYPLRPQFDGRNNWSLCTAVFRTGLPRHPGDRLVVYPMKSDRATVYLDEFEIRSIRVE